MAMGVDNRFKRGQNRYKSVKSISENNLILHLKFSKKQIFKSKISICNLQFDIKLAKIFVERARTKRLLEQKKNFFARAKVLLELKIFLLEQNFFFFLNSFKMIFFN
jgi:hypothetical protein